MMGSGLEFEKLAREIMADSTWTVEPSVKVPEFRLKERAVWMTNHHGYIHSPQSLAALEAYMQGYSLWLVGGLGVGKTFFFQSVGDNDVLRYFSPLKSMAMKLDDIELMIKGWNSYDLVIDDIGAEPVYNNFGSRIDLIPWIVEMRYESCRRTHFTSNLGTVEIGKRYGDRLVDRMGGSAKAFRFEGVSYRRPMENVEAKAMAKRIFG